ncbi:MAG TPA: GntR family transcriptional regulator [Candidatus Methylomirabilis sp.]|nr:GntR family transcriptional regulator [Candidatus Methylomirabilis sp.]
MARESSRISPPSGLRVNRQSAVPVHVQLQTQIRHLISTGSLKPGVQLPTVRQLAGFLRINRNTVARALADLHQDGYLESCQGRGTFVVDRPPSREGRAARSLERLVQDALDRARRLGFTHEELLATIAAHAPQGRAARSVKTRALLVECNQPELSRYREQLEEELSLHVDRLLVEEFQARAAREPAFLDDYRAVITTFFHIHEVKKALPPNAPPAVALLSEANISSLLRLTELPEGTTVGLVCNSPKGSENLLSSIQSAGLAHLVPVLASADDPWAIDRLLEKTRTIVCSEQAVDRIRAQVPLDVEVIIAHRRLDAGGIEMLRDVLAELEGRSRERT